MRHKALTAGFGQKKCVKKRAILHVERNGFCRAIVSKRWVTMRDNAMSHRVIMCNGAVFWIAHAKMNRYKRDSGALACEGFLF